VTIITLSTNLVLRVEVLIRSLAQSEKAFMQSQSI